MPNATETQIKSCIAEFVQELDLIVRRNTLDALKDVLEGREAPARRGRPAGPRRGPGRPPASGDTEGLPAKITACVRSSPGQTVGEIVSGVGVKAAVVKRTIKAMLDTGEIRKAGQKRGTRYFPPGPGRLPGATAKGAKRGKRRAARKAASRTAKRRPSPKKARKAPGRTKRAAARKAMLVPARKRPVPASGTTIVPEHLETAPHKLVLAVAK